MKEALKLALEALEYWDVHGGLNQPTEEAITAIKAALAQDETSSSRGEQEPVAMKFKIYKPTVPDPMRQGINNALLPWVYDQDRSSGFDASMWVTPVATLPPHRTWGKPWVSLTDDEIWKFWCSRPEVSEGEDDSMEAEFVTTVRAVLAAHGIKEKNT